MDNDDTYKCGTVPDGAVAGDVQPAGADWFCAGAGALAHPLGKFVLFGYSLALVITGSMVCGIWFGICVSGLRWSRFTAAGI